MADDKKAFTPDELEEINRRLTERSKSKCEHTMLSDKGVCAGCGVFVDDYFDDDSFDNGVSH